MENPYEPPNTAETEPLPQTLSQHAAYDLRRFLAWYFAAFVLAALLWRLAAFVREFDLLELPMIAFHFPLAGFLDPGGFMLRNPNILFYAIGFWVAVIPVSLLVTPKQMNPLKVSFAIIGVVSIASIFCGYL